MAEPIPLERKPPLPQHETIPNEVREKMGALVARAESIRRVLGANSALPGTRQTAKDQLPLLAREALELWSLI